MYCIVEVHEHWCPEGSIISCWDTEEEANRAYDLNDLDNKTCTNFGSCYFSVLSERELLSIFKDRMDSVL